MDSYKTTFETWNKIASIYEEKFMHLEMYNDTYNLFCEQLKKVNPNILEIGCGPGNITKYISSRRPDFKIEAIDVAPNMIALAQKNNPTVDFNVMDCRTIDSLSSQFDGIICGFCLPYLSKEDTIKLFSNGNHLLLTDGLFYFSAIEGNYQNSGYEMGSSGDKAYVYYYDEPFLQNLINETGFELIQLFRKPYNIYNGKGSTHLIFLVRKVKDILNARNS